MRNGYVVDVYNYLCGFSIYSWYRGSYRDIEGGMVVFFGVLVFRGGGSEVIRLGVGWCFLLRSRFYTFVLFVSETYCFRFLTFLYFCFLLLVFLVIISGSI